MGQDRRLTSALGHGDALVVEWAGDEPRIRQPAPKVIVGTWSQFRRLEDQGIAHRERELVIVEAGDVRAMYRITASDELDVRLELCAESDP